MQGSILTSWVQMLLCLGPWEGEQQSERSSMTPGGSMVSECGCKEVNIADYGLWSLCFYLTTTCLNPVFAYLSLSSRAGVCADPADPWQCRKERRQTLLLFPWEESRLERWGEPQCLSQGGKSMSGKPNRNVNAVRIHAAYLVIWSTLHVLSRDLISFPPRMMKGGRSPLWTAGRRSWRLVWSARWLEKMG